jgi:hypothetical protein
MRARASRIQRLFSEFDRASWFVLAISLALAVYVLLPKLWMYAVPSDGWSLDFSADLKTIFFKSNLSGVASPLQAGDVLLRVAARPVDDLLSGYATFSPQPPQGWAAGRTIQYQVLRDGEAMDLDIPLRVLPWRAFFQVALERWGNPWLAVFMYAFFLPAMLAIGLVVFFLRPRNRAAQTLLLISVAFTGQLPISPFGVASFFYWPLPFGMLFDIWTAVIIPSLVLLVLAFPVPKWLLRSRPILTLVLLYAPWILSTWAVLLVKSGDLWGIYNGWLVVALVQLALVPILFIAPIHSYLTVKDRVARTQLKWFALGIIGFVLAGGLSWTVGTYLNLPVFYTLINYFGYLFLPICLAIAITRYRLFDIDIIIRRTLIYSLITGCLALIYFGSVLLLQEIFQVITGRVQSPIAIVLSTLVIAALFNPLHQRLQDFIDRRFYRRRYDAEQTLAGFGEMLRNEVDLEQISGGLIKIIQETMQPGHASLWLKVKAVRQQGTHDDPGR